MMKIPREKIFHNSSIAGIILRRNSIRRIFSARKFLNIGISNCAWNLVDRVTILFFEKVSTTVFCIGGAGPYTGSHLNRVLS